MLTNEELYNVIKDYAAGYWPDTSDPNQTVVDDLQEFSGRGLEMTWEEHFAIWDRLKLDPRSIPPRG